MVETDILIRSKKRLERKIQHNIEGPPIKNQGVTRITLAYLEQQKPLKIFLSRFIRSPQEIDDIAQETFIRAFSAEKKSKIEYPKAYIYRVARNLALEYLEKRSTRMTCYIEDSCEKNVFQSNEDVESNVDVLHKLELIKHAIAKLPPQCQRVFIMHKVYGFKYKEIANQLEISVSTVEKYMMAGLKQCRKSIKNKEAIGRAVTSLHQYKTSLGQVDKS
ncbi:MAG: hypothetical protein COA43_13340 [Robiginitomaculum sp.]|nr:MAG: hypothetical protein COA43_13340 [Robiginitomaculum sp.]